MVLFRLHETKTNVITEAVRITLKTIGNATVFTVPVP